MANTFKNYRSQNIGNISTNIGSYTVPPSTQTIVIGCSVANVSQNAVIVSVELFDGSAATRIVANATISPGQSLVVVGGDQKVVLQTGHSIRVVSNVSSSIDAIMSVLEIS